MPTRRIKSSPTKVTGTMPDSQRFESTVEEDLLTLLRFNRLVKSVTTQPVAIEWRDAQGEIRTYTPDLFVEYREDLPEAAGLVPMLIEVKLAPSETRSNGGPLSPEDEEDDLKWAAATRYALQRGWGFEVKYGSDFRLPYLANARFLIRYLESREFDPVLEERLLQMLAERGPLTLAQWSATQASGTQDRAKTLPSCYRLIAQQKVDTDLQVRLSLDSMIRSVVSP